MKILYDIIQQRARTWVPRKGSLVKVTDLYRGDRVGFVKNVVKDGLRVTLELIMDSTDKDGLPVHSQVAFDPARVLPYRRPRCPKGTFRIKHSARIYRLCAKQPRGNDVMFEKAGYLP